MCLHITVYNKYIYIYNIYYIYKYVYMDIYCIYIYIYIFATFHVAYKLVANKEEGYM